MIHFLFFVYFYKYKFYSVRDNTCLKILLSVIQNAHLFFTNVFLGKHKHPLIRVSLCTLFNIWNYSTIQVCILLKYGVGNIQWYKTEGSYRFVVACLDLNLILTNCLYKNLTCSNQLSTKVWTISKTREHSASTKWLVFTLLRIFECVDLTWLSQLVKAWLLRQWDILYTKAPVKFRWVQGLNLFSQIPAHMCLYKYTK